MQLYKILWRSIIPDKVWKKYQSYFDDESGKQKEGIIIRARNKKEAAEIADGMYGDDAEVRPLKVKK